MIFAKTRQHAKPILIMLLFYMGVCIWSIYVYICIYIYDTYIMSIMCIYVCACARAYIGDIYLQTVSITIKIHIQ